MKLLYELILGVVLALLIRKYLLFLVLVRGRSMQPTLQGGEVLLGLRYGRREVRRGDIVICRLEKIKPLLIKRVIALPGESIRIEEGQVYIDDMPLNEPYIRAAGLRKMDVCSLGTGEYFVMGDNRLASQDSRRLGPARRRDIQGRCVRVLLPLKAWRSLK